jgi:hypothetical protein
VLGASVRHVTVTGKFRSLSAVPPPPGFGEPRYVVVLVAGTLQVPPSARGFPSPRAQARKGLVRRPQAGRWQAERKTQAPRAGPGLLPVATSAQPEGANTNVKGPTVTATVTGKQRRRGGGNMGVGHHYGIGGGNARLQFMEQVCTRDPQRAVLRVLRCVSVWAVCNGSRYPHPL